MEKKLQKIHEFIIANDIATEDEISLVTAICGYNEETLNDIINVRTGCDMDQLEDDELDDDADE